MMRNKYLRCASDIGSLPLLDRGGRLWPLLRGRAVPLPLPLPAWRGERAAIGAPDPGLESRFRLTPSNSS
jgi:hypothetical protein